MQKSNISNKVHPQSHGLPQLTETGPPLSSRKSRSLAPRQQPNPDRPTVLRPSKQLTTRSSPSWGERPPPLCGSPQHLRTLIGRLERRGQARCAPGTSGLCQLPSAKITVQSLAQRVTWRVRGRTRVDRFRILVARAATWGRGVFRLVRGILFR